jgi:outer membrane receptor protein involved in Fe transport
MRLKTHLGIRTALVGSVALSALLIGREAARADTGSQKNANSGQIEQVVVTANKVPQILFDVPMSVTAISGSALLNRNLNSFAEYAALVPGLAVEQGPPADTRLIIRGLNTGGAGATVSVYVDGSPIGSSTSFGASSYSPDADPYDMKQVEVLKGPQGTLYGADAEGGLIKFISNPPDTSKYEASGEAQVESVAKGGTAYSLRGLVNIPFADNTAALRISGYWDQLPGYIYNTRLKMKNSNHGIREGVRASLLFKPTDDLSFRVTGFWQKVQTSGTPYEDVVGSAYSYAAPPTNKFAPYAGDLQKATRSQEPNSSKFYLVNGRATWNLHFATLESTTSYSESKSFSLADDSNFVAGLAPPTSAVAPYGLPYSYFDVMPLFTGGIPAVPISQDAFSLKKITEELHLYSYGNERLDWQVGVFYTHEQNNSHYGVKLDQLADGISTGQPVPGIAAGADLVNAAYEEFAGFAHLSYHFSDQLSVAAGLRVSGSSQHVIEGQQGGVILGPSYGYTLNTNEANVTYSVAPSYKLNKDTFIYGRVASGYRPGGPNLIPLGAPANYPRSYGPDSTVNYEVGLRTGFFNNSVTADVDLFRIDWTKVQIVSLVNGYTVTGNAGTARSQGVEWSLGWRPIDGLKLKFVGAYVDAQLTQDARQLGGTAGDALPYAPNWTTSLDGEYDWPVGNAMAFVGGTYSFIGKRYTDFGTLPYMENHVSLPTYGTLSLRSGVEMRHWRVQLFVTNLTDERGITSYVSAGGGDNAITGYAGVIQPRTIGLLLSANL